MSSSNSTNPIKVAVITVSDTCHENQSNKKLDLSGDYLVSAFASRNLKYTVLDKAIVPDDKNAIQENVLHFVKRQSDLIVLTGGTGFTERDVTPESVMPLFTKEVPGIQIALITESLKKTKFAMLSRLVCGIRDSCLIVTFPGSEKACRECFETVEPILQHAIDQLRSEFTRVKNVHNDKRLLESKATVPTMVERYNNMPKSKITFNEAITIVINESIKRPKEFDYLNVEDYSNFGFFCADELRSPMNLPPFRASLKDGYAVRSIDGNNDRFTMPKPMSAGITDCEHLKENYCYRINTGAYIPDSADSIVKVEDTQLIEQVGDEYKIKINKIPKANDDVKQIGADLKMNDLLLEKGAELTSASFGLLASVNYHKIKVYKKPRIGILSTGDELLTAGNEYRLPYVYDSNRSLIKNLLASKHYTDLVDLGIADDELNSLYRKLVDAFERADILITSGGVSMGERDYLKLILQSDFNARIHFSRVAIKPGMPFVFATLVYKERLKFVFGLPGNPVSCFVISTLFLLPALKSMIKDETNFVRYLSLDNKFYDLLKINESIYVKLSSLDEFSKFAADNRPEFVRCLIRFTNCIEKDSLDELADRTNLLPTAYLINEQQHSSRLLSIQGANALVLIDPENRASICKAVLF